MAKIIFDAPIALHNEPPPHPRDPADFRRCQMMLDMVNHGGVPHARVVQRMRGASPAWTRLAHNWQRLTELYAEELKSGQGSAPRLAAAISELIEPRAKTRAQAGAPAL